jgi:hypothetical protein
MYRFTASIDFRDSLGTGNASRRRGKKFFSLLNAARRIFIHSETEALSSAPVFRFFITHDCEELNKFYMLLKVMYFYYFYNIFREL